MAPWVFAAPAVAFALLPSVVGAASATDGTAVVAGVTALCALAGVAVQPLARRLDARAEVSRAAPVGLIVLTVGLALSAATAALDRLWLLFPCAVVLGAAYGLCLVAGLVQVQRLAPPNSLARLTAAFYVLTYLGFAAPYVPTLGSSTATSPRHCLRRSGGTESGSTVAQSKRRPGSLELPASRWTIAFLTAPGHARGNCPLDRRARLTPSRDWPAAMRAAPRRPVIRANIP